MAYTLLLGNNLYAYCANNPVSFVDLEGTMWQFNPLMDPRAMTYSSAGKIPAGMGGPGQYDSSSYDSYRIRSISGAADAALGGYYFGGLSSAVMSPGSYIVPGAVSVTDDMAIQTGYSTFRQLKKAIGSAGEGNEWHHIVEQNQIAKSGLSPQAIHSVHNIISISKTTHRLISGYYSSKQPFTNGMTVRNWLAGQSFAVQYEFGLNVIKMFS